MNHDALFKMLLKAPTILRGFFEAFLPEVARFIDFGVLEFIDKERYTIDGRKRTGDLLVKTRFKGEAAGFLIHLEHQAQPEPDLGRRMLEYLVLDWRDFKMPVYPIAVLSHREGTSTSQSPLRLEFPNKCILHFEFDIIDLGSMQAELHLKTANPAALALAARMKIDAKKRLSLTRDFFIQLSESSIDLHDKLLVAGFFSAYQRLSGSEALQLEREMSKLSPDMAREKVIELTNPFIQLGVRRGRKQGEIELVLRLLKRRLGSLTASQKNAVRRLKHSRVEMLGEALLEFASGGDLDRWLNAHST